MRRPYGNTFGPDGHLYVASFRSDEILKFDGRTGAFLSVFARGDGTAAGRGEVFAPMPAPVPGGAGYVSFLGLAWGPDGRLWTSDYAGGVRAYTRGGGQPAVTIDTGRLFGGSMPTPLGNLVFSDGTIYLPVFDSDGTATVANGVAACDPVAAACRLLMRDDTRLSRPIGIAVAR